MSNLCSAARRRLLHISACAVAGVSIGGSLAAAAKFAMSSSSGETTLTGDSPCVVSSSTSCADNDLRTYHFTESALGANVSLAIVHTESVVAQQIATLAFAEISRLERIFSLYMDDSSVTELNANGKLEQPPAELLSVFSQITGVWLATGGAFDPTVQPHWNERFNESNAQQSFSWRDVKYTTSAIEFNKPAMAITLNGIAQGYISEQIAILLRKQGLENILVNVGEIVAVGNRSDGKSWQVGLAELQSDSAQQSIELSDNAIATSAPLSSVTQTQVSAGHIVDPATGRSCDSPWYRLSVIHPSAAIADGLSTGLVMKSAATIQKAITHYPQAKVMATDLVGDHHTFVHHS